MIDVKINGNNYRLPERLTEFQTRMYTHLIDWKWNHITREAGCYRGIEYDAFFPESILNEKYPLYREILPKVKQLHFKQHKFFQHMVSSQAACINLFLPIMTEPLLAVDILRIVKDDISRIATEYLDGGFQFEFWYAPWQSFENKGVLNDHSNIAGTDSDFAVMYYDKDDNLCLWLIEHKLTESGFTKCGGYRSKGNNNKANCKSIEAIIKNKNLCYYSIPCQYQYWKYTTEPHFSIQNISQYETCPFMDDLNQLWRNQTLACAIETAPVKKTFFSVVYHPQNPSLGEYLQEFKRLAPSRFSYFTTDMLINKADNLKNPRINEWVKWYKDMYYPVVKK